MMPVVDGLLDRLAETATPYTLALSLPYVLALTAVALEVAWLARRPGPRRVQVLRSAVTAAAMGAGAFFVVGVIYAAALGAAWEVLAGHAPAALTELWRRQPVLGAVIAFAAWDLVGWVYHLIGHRTRVGWAAHQPHHSGEAFDLTLGLRQSWAPFHGLAVHPLLALAGFDLRVILVCAAISNGWQVLEHTAAPVRFPRWFESAVMTPAAHRFHHGVDAGAVNLGPVFTVWDRLAGTWRPATTPGPAAYGLGRPTSANPIAVELAGWRELARARARVSRGRLDPWLSNASESSAAV